MHDSRDWSTELVSIRYVTFSMCLETSIILTILCSIWLLNFSVNESLLHFGFPTQQIFFFPPRVWVVMWSAANRVSLPTTKSDNGERAWERGWWHNTAQTTCWHSSRMRNRKSNSCKQFSSLVQQKQNKGISVSQGRCTTEEHQHGGFILGFVNLCPRSISTNIWICGHCLQWNGLFSCKYFQTILEIKTIWQYGLRGFISWTGKFIRCSRLDRLNDECILGHSVVFTSHHVLTPTTRTDTE